MLSIIVGYSKFSSPFQNLVGLEKFQMSLGEVGLNDDCWMECSRLSSENDFG
jgi:hypothetical protein